VPSRRKRTYSSRLIATVKRNPAKSVALALGIVGGIPSALAGIEYWWPYMPTSHRYIDDEVLPKRDHVLDYLIQDQAQRALNDAKTDMVKAPNPTTQATIDRLTKSIAKRQDKMDRENGRDEN
jgi:hypothetical protein